eukprot:5994383-Pyramimonas_sp.AAC.1
MKHAPPERRPHLAIVFTSERRCTFGQLTNSKLGEARDWSGGRGWRECGGVRAAKRCARRRRRRARAGKLDSPAKSSGHYSWRCDPRGGAERMEGV